MLALCGDGNCTASDGEDCVTCPSDCDRQSCGMENEIIKENNLTTYFVGVCGDGVCDGNEDCSTCKDCGPCSTLLFLLLTSFSCLPLVTILFNYIN